MADHDLDRSHAAGTDEAGVPRHAEHTEPQDQEPQNQESQDQEPQDQESRHTGPQHDEPRPPRLFGPPAPSGTRGGLGPQEYCADPELPDAFAPGVALSAMGGTALGGALGGALNGAEAEPGAAADPYGTPDDYDTAEAYGPAYDDEGEHDSSDAYRPEGGSEGGSGGQGLPTSAPQTVTADSLTTDLLLPGRRKAPPGGWRRAIFGVTGGLVRVPESAAQRRHTELTARARTPVAGGHHRVAVLSLKGGVGKTTTTVGLGATLASLRGDRVIAVDANPDRGTLSDKLRLETSATVRDLLNERDQIRRYADVRAYTTQAPSRLEVLASDRDPTVSVAFSEQDYCDVARVLERYYSICLTDCGTGLLHSAMTGVLRLADQIVLVSSPSVDGARSASATLDWLQAHGYGDLARHAVVVLAVIRPRGKSAVDTGRLEQHFAARCRAVVRVPYDAHLDEGAEVELGRLNGATADAFLMLAAETGDGLAQPPEAGS